MASEMKREPHSSYEGADITRADITSGGFPVMRRARPPRPLALRALGAAAKSSDPTGMVSTES